MEPAGIRNAVPIPVAATVREYVQLNVSARPGHKAQWGFADAQVNRDHPALPEPWDHKVM
ncbi:hypothetical protein K250101E9_18700 [Enterocloster aldenensis]